MSDAKPRRPAREPAVVAAAAPSDTQPAEPPTAMAKSLIEPELPPAASAPAALPPPDVWATLTAAQAALARGLGEAAVEVTGMTRTGLAAGSEAAIALIGATTLAEIVEVNAGLARRGADAMIEGSARLSEIAVKALADASRAFLPRFGTG